MALYNRAKSMLIWLAGLALLFLAVPTGPVVGCPTPPEGTFTVQADDGVTLSYRAIGTGDQAVIFIHGWMVSGKIWDDMLPVFEKAGLRLIIPDLRGTGSSGSPPTGYTLERYAKDILTIAQHEHLHKYVLFGHSMGGQIAQLIATKQPGKVKGLALLAAVPASGVPLPPDAVNLFRNSAQNRTLQGIILDLATLQLPPDAKERILDDAGTISVACIQESFDAWTAGGFADQLYKINAPTIVVGTQDPFLPPDFLKATEVEPIRNARFAYLPGPGHYLENEQPLQTAALLQTFLAGLKVDED